MCLSQNKFKTWSEAFMICKEEIDVAEQKFVAGPSKKWGCIDTTSEVIAQNNVQASCPVSPPKKNINIHSFEQFDIHNDLLCQNPNQKKDGIEHKLFEKPFLLSMPEYHALRKTLNNEQ